MDRETIIELAKENMRQECVKFCPDTALNYYKHEIPKQIKKQQTQYKNIIELSGVQNSEVRSTDISDPTGRIGVHRVSIEEQIAILNADAAQVRKAISQMDEFQQRIIELFYFSKGMMGYNVQRFADENYMSVAGVYRERNQSLKSFSEIMEEWLNLT